MALKSKFEVGDRIIITNPLNLELACDIKIGMKGSIKEVYSTCYAINIDDRNNERLFPFDKECFDLFIEKNSALIKWLGIKK